MSRTPPQEIFPEFYGNDHVQALGQSPRWTVSDKEKCPIDMKELMATGKLQGAWRNTQECLVTLDELAGFMPGATNTAFRLQSQTDGYLVLDIEPTCPPETTAMLMGLPSLWTEYSMSGKGYHLLLPMPSNFWDYPIATVKTALRGPGNHYEILLDHWITFTREPVLTRFRDAVPLDWPEFYASLAREAVESPTAHLDIGDLKPLIEHEAEIVAHMIAYGPGKKSLVDFGNDHSAYEFSVMGRLRHAMSRMLAQLMAAYDGLDYTWEQQVWLVYEAALETFPHRPKHDELRSGMPLLFDRAKWVIGRQAADQAREGEPR